MNTRNIRVICSIALVILLTASLAGCGKTLPEGHYYREGLYLRCDNGSEMILLDSTEPCAMTADNESVSFDALTDGDKIKIEVYLIEETYPAKTTVYSLEKLADGERADLDSEVMARLVEMGWINAE